MAGGFLLAQGGTEGPRGWVEGEDHRGRGWGVTGGRGWMVGKWVPYGCVE